MLIVLLAAVLGVSVAGQGPVRLRVTPGVGLAALPLLTMSQVIGGMSSAVGMRFPQGTSNGQGVGNHAPGAFAIDTATNTVYGAIAGIEDFGYVSEFTIPTLVNSSTVSSLNTGSYDNGGIYDALEGQMSEADNNDVNPAAVWALLVEGSTLYGNVSISYDTGGNGGAQIKHIFSRPKSLSTTGSFKGIDQYGPTSPFVTGNTHYAGFLSGYIGRIPSEWQSSFGGKTHFMGQCCQSIITRNSYGPAASVFDPTLIGTGGSQPYFVKPIVYYSSEHPTLGCWEEPDPLYPSVGHGNANKGCQNTYFGYTTAIKGAVMINGTRTMAFFGRQGTGTPCYGPGLGDPDDPLIGTPYPDPVGGPHTYCYDPASSDEGNHQYPYVYFVWLYDINDLVAAYNSSVNPYDVLPYDGGTFTFPVTLPANQYGKPADIGGADYDPVTHGLYLTQRSADELSPGGTVQSILWKITITGIP